MLRGRVKELESRVVAGVLEGLVTVRYGFGFGFGRFGGVLEGLVRYLLVFFHMDLKTSKLF